MIRLLSSLVLLAGASLARGNVLGIDLGSENMKLGLVSPGKFDIVTNFQSKRKTPISLTFYRNERMFGADSAALMPKKPELTFSNLLRVLGKPHDHPDVTSLKQKYFPTEFVLNETTGFTSMRLSEDVLYTPQELLGMMLQHAKDITKDYTGGNNVKDCVVTVPSSFTQHERRALYQAASLVDLNILSLVEENTAAALQFGIDRVFEEPNNVLFFNMGAGSTQVTIAQFSSMVVKEGGKNKTVGQFQIVGKAWDNDLGGFNYDLVITEMLADRFNAIWNKKKNGEGKDIRDHVRPMTKLRVEAKKLREVLSANQEMSYKAEQLHADIDMYTKITRSEFEEASAHLFAKTTESIDKALKMAGMTLEDIHAVELLGGGIRMPKVKQQLENYFKEGDLELGVHLNGDEAMALGAAFRAANISTAFRVRKVGMSDLSVYGITVELQGVPSVSDANEAPSLSSWLKPSSWVKKASDSEADKKSDDNSGDASDSEVWAKSTVLFPPKAKVPSKIKTVAFQHTEDLMCRLSYDDSEEAPFLPGMDRTIGVFNISGIAAFSREAEEKGLGAPKVHLSFTLDASGVVSLTKAEATVDLPLEPEEPGSIEEENVSTEDSETVEKTAEKTAEKSSEEGVEQEEATGDSKEENETTTKTEDKQEKKSKQKNQKKSKQPKKKQETQLRRPLLVQEQLSATTPPGMSSSDLAISKKRLTRLAAADAARKAWETAMNDLEAYAYQVRNRLREEDGEDQLGSVSTESQREEVIALCDEVEEWLYDEGRNAEMSEFRNKESDIRTLAEKIFRRFKESQDRPRAVKRALKQLKNVTKKVDTWGEKMPHITEEEIQELRDLISGVEGWIESKVAEQEAADPTEEPVFTAYDVVAEMKPVSSMFEKLLRKPKPKPPKPNTTATSENATKDDEPETVYVDLNADKEGESTAEEGKESAPAEGDEL